MGGTCSLGIGCSSWPPSQAGQEEEPLATSADLPSDSLSAWEILEVDFAPLPWHWEDWSPCPSPWQLERSHALNGFLVAPDTVLAQPGTAVFPFLY